MDIRGPTLLLCEEGQGLVEYALLLFVIVTFAAVAVIYQGGQLKNMFEQIGNTSIP